MRSEWRRKRPERPSTVHDDAVDRRGKTVSLVRFHPDVADELPVFMYFNCKNEEFLLIVPRKNVYSFVGQVVINILKYNTRQRAGKTSFELS